MKTAMIIQGRETNEEEIHFVKQFIQKNPNLHRTALSKELATLWDWRDHTGRLKDMACRTFMLKLHRQGHIILPPPRRPAVKRKSCFLEVPHSKAPRDSFIGWSHETRKIHLDFIVNNSRFLILPWIKISHLASYLLGALSRRIQKDWIQKYHHPIYLLETFVQKDRFKGTSYKAANWQYLGDTKGLNFEYLED